MPKLHIFILLILVLAASQPYLPKQLDYLLVNDIYAKDVTRSGRDTFWKVEKQGPAAIISAYPVRPNSLTRVTFQLVVNNQFHFAIGQKDVNQLKKGNPYYMANTLTYHTYYGQKYTQLEGANYAPRAFEGDNITMVIDLRPMKNQLSYERNGLPLGIAFSGLNQWQDIYIIFSLWAVNSRVKIVEYTVVE